MPDRLTYRLQLMEHGMDTQYPSIQTEGSFSPWAQNVRIDQHSILKRPGYALDRDLRRYQDNGAILDDVTVYNIVLFQQSNGSRYTLYLTDKDLIKRLDGGGRTWTYLTPTYTTGAVTHPGVAYGTIIGSGTAWQTNSIENGDMFIKDVDHSSAYEPDTEWMSISVASEETTASLSGSYDGTTAGSRSYKIRKVYSVPANERWSWTIVDDKFIFTNGNVDVQYWDDSLTYATALDSTYAKQARYCTEFANRLFLADAYNESTADRDPYMVRWSAEGDPTDWTDSTAGSWWALDTEDYIRGIRSVGANIIVFKDDSIMVGGRTGSATNPVSFNTPLKGVGLVAPWSLVDAAATLMWLGRDDFYYFDGTMPRPLGGGVEARVRFKFFDIISPDQTKNVWGTVDTIRHQAKWMAPTADGNFEFVFDYKTQEWTVNQYRHDMVAAGRGAI